MPDEKNLVVDDGAVLDTVPPDSAAPDSAPAERSASGGWRRPALIAGGLLLVASVVCATFFFLQYRQLKNDDASGILVAQQSAREAACSYISGLVNYDAANLDPFFAAAKDGATGEWQKMISDSEPEMRKTFTEKQVKGQGGTPECGVKSGDEQNASIVTYVTQSLSATDTQGQMQQGPPVFVVMDMQNVDGRWLVAKFNAPFLGP